MSLRDTVQELLRNMVQGHPSVVEGRLVGSLDKTKHPYECTVEFFDPSAGIMRQEDKVPFVTPFFGRSFFVTPSEGDTVVIAFRSGDMSSPRVIDWQASLNASPEKTTSKLDNG